MKMVFPPIRESLFMSDNEATPMINELSTSGIATNLRRLMKMVPNGAIQSLIQPPQEKFTATTPKMTPKASAIMICQCSLRYQCMETPVCNSFANECQSLL